MLELWVKGRCGQSSLEPESFASGARSLRRRCQYTAPRGAPTRGNSVLPCLCTANGLGRLSQRPKSELRFILPGLTLLPCVSLLYIILPRYVHGSDEWYLNTWAVIYTLYAPQNSPIECPYWGVLNMWNYNISHKSCLYQNILLFRT